MGILNITPNSFSDGGMFFDRDRACAQAEKLIADGADILDIGGESTRPNSARVPQDEELQRVLPVIKEVRKRFDVSVSIDTSKSEVAERAIDAGAEIINDVSGLKFDPEIADIAAKHETGLILMHLRGSFETMHSQDFNGDIIGEVVDGLAESISIAKKAGIGSQAICLDPGFGFSKSFEQNIELISRFDEVALRFREYPMLAGISRKSFIGKMMDEGEPGRREFGGAAANTILALKGADILRVHDVAAAKAVADVVGEVKKTR